MGQGQRSTIIGGLNQTSTSQTYLFSGLLQCGTCSASIVITSGGPKYVVYRCPYYRFRGVSTNRTTIRREVLESQLLSKIAEVLGAPESATLIKDEFDRQLAAAVSDKVAAYEGGSGKRDDLTREHSILAKKIMNLADAIANHGMSISLSDRLRQSEGRLQKVDNLLLLRARLALPNISETEKTAFLV